jgi:hypothetical protein
MFEKILDGELPSLIFRKLIEVDPTIGNIRLGEMLSDEFVKLDSQAEQLIWHWKGPGKTQGLSDESLDAELLRMLREAGYL